MTVLAWDGRTLAADKRGNIYGLNFTCTKLFRVGPDMLVGVHGELCRGLQLVDWVRSGKDPQLHPHQDKDDATFLLIIHRGGRIERVESTGFGITIEDKQWADGSGRDFAIAGMHLGLSAEDAVALASRFTNSCGNGVDTLCFDDEAPIEERAAT
jgi:hypothetical protein